MIQFKYKDENDWKLTTWAWFTLDSYNQSCLSGDIRLSQKNMNFQDAMILKASLGGMLTGQALAHRGLINRKAAEAAFKSGRAKLMKDLFTAPCPICKHPGDAIPRDQEKFRNAPPGLYCPNCDKSFSSVSIYVGKIAFLVAAGPSLSKNVGQLKRVMGKYPIFVVDTALPTIQQNGVRPDYVVTVEQDPLINMMNKSIDSEGIPLIATITTDPEFRNSWKGPVYFFDSPTQIKRELKKRQKMFGDLGWASPGGNVSTTAFSILTGLFLSRIIFVGHDFSYPSLERYYPNGGPRSMIPMKEVIKTHDIYRNIVYTDLSLYGYKCWTENMINILRKENRGIISFVNATEGGIFGATYYDPKRFIKFHTHRRILQYKLGRWLKERRWPSDEEAGENGFKTKNLDCIEYMTLKEAIDKYCPLAFKE